MTSFFSTNICLWDIAGVNLTVNIYKFRFIKNLDLYTVCGGKEENPSKKIDKMFFFFKCV